MGHEIIFPTFPVSMTQQEIFDELTSMRCYSYFEGERHYHGNMTFHPRIVFQSRKNAEDWMMKESEGGFYEDHAVKLKENGAIQWICKVEWHC